MQSAAMHGSDAHASIVGDDETVRILRINPDVMSVSSPGDLLEVLPAVQRSMERTTGDVNLIFISCRDCDSDVIASSSDQRALIVECFPMFSSVVRTPE